MAAAYAESSNVPSIKTRDRARRVMDSLLPGPPEMPFIAGTPDPKTTEDAGCVCKKKNDFEKAIVSVVGGVWQVATFWYPDSGCSHSASSDNPTK
jgi:hypothetical protein